MPLVVISGLPSSGKSTLARILADYLSAENRRVRIVGDDVLGAEMCTGKCKNELYTKPLMEKQLRDMHRTEIQQALQDAELVVVLDSFNGVSGFRYEMFCLCREFAQTYAVLHTDVTLSTSFSWNSSRPASVFLGSYFLFFNQ